MKKKIRSILGMVAMGLFVVLPSTCDEPTPPPEPCPEPGPPQLTQIQPIVVQVDLADIRFA
jgi:hypothetical protein